MASVTPSNPSHGPKKKFGCVWPACGKSFSRSEHLHRHALNHKEGNNTCPRCATHFRRRDLLDRHMIRHKEKDDEAGGEGLGHLATRKRLWRDANGNIVNAKRPHRPDGAKSRQLTSEEEYAETGDYDDDGSSRTRLAAPPSPPTSIHSTRHTSNEQLGCNGLLQDAWPTVDRNASRPNDNGDPSDFLCNASWGSQPFQTLMGAAPDLPYDDIFKPDTAMSFNAPFTTLSYYSWLFEKDSLNGPDGSLLRLQPSAAVSADESISNRFHEKAYDSSMNLQMQNNFAGGGLDSHLLPSSHLSNGNHEGPFMLSNTLIDPRPSHQLQGHGQHTPKSVTENHQTANFTTQDIQCAQSPMLMGKTLANNGALEYSHSTPRSGEHYELNCTDFDKSAILSYYFSSQDSSYSATSSASKISTPPNRRSVSVSSHTLPDAYPARCVTKLPSITNEAREGIVQAINQACPTKPDGTEINSSDPLLSLSSLQHFSDLFFTHFNSSYPLIHQATFESGQVHTFLLMSLVLLGATYSDKDAHLLAVCVHDIMRPLIHASKEFSTRPKLWMLQTILLVECFGKSRAGEKQHDMSHLYHGLLINLIRRSDCQSAFIHPFDEQTQDLEEYWRLSVEVEQKRRLVMLCFMWDTQHAVLFSQSLCMNASELKITLPWDNAVWEANTSSEWLFLWQRTPPPPQYLSILKMYTNLSTNCVPPHLNALSRVLILHGLMSISWDLHRRDQTSLSLSVTLSSTPWQTRMSSCYASWKTDFESYTASVLSCLSFSLTQREKFRRFSVANLAIYHTAQLILEVDIIDVQIHAGARHIIGRPVTDTDRARSRARVGEWIARDEGKRAGKAVWHAARIFRDGIRKLENWNVDEMFHYPWCLYLATLMCWTFHEAAKKEPPSLSSSSNSHAIVDCDVAMDSAFPPANLDVERSLPAPIGTPDDEDSDWDSHVEMNALISGLTRLDPAKESFVQEIWEVGGKDKTQGLLRCMVKQLNTVRWAVVREGMVVLRSLIPRSSSFVLV